MDQKQITENDISDEESVYIRKHRKAKMERDKYEEMENMRKELQDNKCMEELTAKLKEHRLSQYKDKFIERELTLDNLIAFDVLFLHKIEREIIPPKAKFKHRNFEKFIRDVTTWSNYCSVFCNTNNNINNNNTNASNMVSLVTSPYSVAIFLTYIYNTIDIIINN